MNNKIKLIIEREYMTKVRKKSFVIMSILGPLLFVGVFAVVAFLASVNKDHKTIAVYDETSLFSETFISNSETQFVYYPTTGLAEAIDSVKKNNYYGLIHIPYNIGNNLELIETSIQFLSDESPSVSVIQKIKLSIERKIRSLKLLELGTSEELVKKANVDISMRFVNYEGELKNSKIGLIQISVGAFSGIMIYMFILMYGVQVMKSVIEEKTNRIVEVIISSVKPFELMMGKIIGSALVGLTQFFLWTILSGILMTIAQYAFDIDAPSKQIIQESSPELDNGLQELIASIFELDFALILGAFVFFFLGGYLLYSALFAAIGSAVDSETDTQQFMLPITLPLIIALYSGFMVLENPNGPVAFWLSMIPFTSPIVMMARIPFDVPAWEIALSMLLLIIGFILTTIFAAKIYKTGILMYGKKPTYGELWKWLRY